MTKPTIIPIASGKGGVGKTFFAANLAIALAEMGHPTIAVDMDLGGSNLHFFLGLPNRFPGIGSFLKERSAELEEMLIPTEIPNLQFLPGDGMSPFMANIPHAQKIRLISRIVKLPAEYILLDLGAGTSFNTLDFFRLSRHGFVVTTPEHPAIINMMTFLKHLMLRIIAGNFTENHRICEMLRSIYKVDKQINIEALQSKIAAIDHEAGKTVTELCRNYRPRLVFNMGEHPDEIKLSEQINKNLKSILSIEIDYFGFIFNDPAVRQSIKKKIPFIPCYRKKMTTQNIERIAKRIEKYWNKPVNNSSLHLLNHTREIYEKHNIKVVKNQI
ncbi:MAG: P-loop NTPase [Desulfobacterales bacterium]|nr:P-loop NTPase [Desulfobacterales bacterium]MBU8911741.1 P-loop NTPase [Desulfobacterales bacterium]